MWLLLLLPARRYRWLRGFVGIGEVEVSGYGWSWVGTSLRRSLGELEAGGVRVEPRRLHWRYKGFAASAIHLMNSKYLANNIFF
jgi:hypothetical protein